MRQGRVLLVGGLFAALLIGAVSPSSALTNDQKVKLTDAIKNQPPIEFFTVKGAPDACGPGCDSWIAAEGFIDAEAAPRLRQTLEKLGKRKLPIYFNSTGGSVIQGMAIGRMLRGRGMTAGVARTLAAKCLPTKSVYECARLLRTNPESEGVLRTDNARCLSACAIAIIGAISREIAPDALLGVHAAFTYVAHPPHGATERQLDKVSERASELLEKSISNYVAEMKLGRELVNISWKTKFEDMHYLTRAELFDLGIDRRESAEFGWHFGYQPVPAVGSAAFVNLRSESDSAPADQKPATLIFSCDMSRSGSFLLTSLQPIPKSSTRPARDLRVSAGTLSIMLKFGSSFLTSYNGEPFEVRQERAVARAWVEAFTKAPTITIVEQPLASGNERGNAGEAPAAQFSIPDTGVAGVFKMLDAHCAQLEQSARIAVIAPPSAQDVFSSGGEGRDSGWRYAFLPVAAIGSSAFAEAATSATDQLLLAISCGVGNTYTISTVRRMTNASATPRFDIFVGEEALGLTLWATGSVVTTWKAVPYDLRQSKWPRSVVEKLMASSKITVTEKPRVAAVDADPANARQAPPAQFLISTKGTRDAFMSLADHCAMLN